MADAVQDYGGFGGILQEARALDEQRRAQVELACPRCGYVLDVNREGERNCPMGHYRTSGPVPRP